jgi:cellulose biosynthesis protein BcsQ
LAALLSEIPTKYDLVLVDTPPLLTADLDQILKLARLVILPVRESIHSLRGALAVLKITSAPCKALPYYVDNNSELAQVISNELDLLDGRISIAPEVLVAEAKMVSVLTDAKNSEVAQQYRDATYSLLEELNIF